ncbi:MAG: hypothetical protein HEP71_03380 [Roseivirga sp.]|nr:hypothetical protein [Roseivirga sp.]
MLSFIKPKTPLLCLFLSAILFACNSETDETTPTPIEEPDPGTAVNIPDQIFEQRLLTQGVDTDGEINGQIWLEDALEVTDLELFSSDDEAKITDLTGIEAFKNLKFLSVDNNALQTISLSENTTLERLTLNSNQLTTVDLSANTKLISVTIDWNDLVEINLNANTKLQNLSLKANQLQSLDISQNTELEKLDVIVNELKSVTGLDKTTKLRTLNLAWNDLVTLDLNLPTLEGLNVEQNLLTSLKVDGCTSLEYLLATQNQIVALNTDTNRALKHLKVSYNQITSLALSNNTNLEKLWTSGNQLSNLDVSQSPGLYDLRIIRNENLNCIKISSEQNFGTLQKENHQSLTTGNCG